jgi:hypothetical protein
MAVFENVFTVETLLSAGRNPLSFNAIWYQKEKKDVPQKELGA